MKHEVLLSMRGDRGALRRPPLWLWLLVATAASQMTIEDDVDGLKKMSFRPPTLSEEEEHATHMPEDMRCDACQASAFQFHEAVSKAHDGKSNAFRLSESQIIQMAEQVCHSETFKNYGMALESSTGRNRLKGPGIYDEPGVAHMGGRTPYRLAEICREIVSGDDVLTEFDLYEHWLVTGRKPATLIDLICGPTKKICRKAKRRTKPKKDDL